MFISYLEELINSELDVIAKFQQNFMIAQTKSSECETVCSIMLLCKLTYSSTEKFSKIPCTDLALNSCDYGNT